MSYIHLHYIRQYLPAKYWIGTSVRIYSHFSEGFNNISPWYATGFSDAESSFSLFMNKNGKSFSFSYSVAQSNPSRSVLYDLQAFFSAGSISEGPLYSQYAIKNMRDLVKIVIPHFDTYFLQGSKQLDYLDWRSAVLTVWKNKEEGIKRTSNLSQSEIDFIQNLISQMNNKRSERERAHFISHHTIEIDPQWIAGFTDGEAHYQYAIASRHTRKSHYLSCEATFEIKQSYHDVLLLEAIRQSLGHGYISPKTKTFSFEETSQAQHRTFKLTVRQHETIVSRLSASSLRTQKRFDCQDWIRLIELKKAQAHKHPFGLILMRHIKININKGRKG